VGTKTCRICGDRKPLSAFYRAAGMRDGYRNECRACFQSKAKARYQADPGARARAVASASAWRERNPEQAAAYQAAYRQRPERKRAMRDLYYRRTYGLTADEVDDLLEAQGGGCAICGARPERLASLHLDHDHATGAIRGFLCIDCNHGLGKLRDDPTLLRRAADYVAAHRGA
jgi:hypothetical protein